MQLALRTDIFCKRLIWTVQIGHTTLADHRAPSEKAAHDALWSSDRSFHKIDKHIKIIKIVRNDLDIFFRLSVDFRYVRYSFSWFFVIFWSFLVISLVLCDLPLAWCSVICQGCKLNSPSPKLVQKCFPLDWLWIDMDWFWIDRGVPPQTLFLMNI